MLFRSFGITPLRHTPGHSATDRSVDAPPRSLSSLASGACPMGTTSRLSDLWVRLGSFGTVWVSFYCLYVGFSLLVHCRLGFLGSSWRVVYGGPPCGICFFTHLSSGLSVFMLAAWRLDRGGCFVVYILLGDVTDLYHLNKE